MSSRCPWRSNPSHKRIAAPLLGLALIGVLVFLAQGGADPAQCSADKGRISDHFDGELFFNPGSRTSPAEEAQRRSSGWIWLRFFFGIDWPKWPEMPYGAPGEPPALRAPKGSLIITPVGHATFLIQMDGLNILTDPIWSERCSPVSWAGPKRYRAPGLRFEDLPPIDAVLVSHNHYDHLDLATLERLAKKGTPRSITTLGNRDLIREAGIPIVNEFDWWQSVRLSEEVTVTLVPAQHFSARTPWDRNKTLWGGFVISGPAGHVYFAGDTGYGIHFREIAKRFSPIRAALLPISPFWPQNAADPPPSRFSRNHMGPAEAVQAHLDLGAEVSIAAHFQVFQLGIDGFDDAPKELKSALVKHDLKSDAFIAPSPGRPVELTASRDHKAASHSFLKARANR